MPRRSSPSGRERDELADVARAARSSTPSSSAEQPPDRVAARRSAPSARPGRPPRAADLDARVLAEHPRVRRRRAPRPKRALARALSTYVAAVLRRELVSPSSSSSQPGSAAGAPRACARSPTQSRASRPTDAAQSLRGRRSRRGARRARPRAPRRRSRAGAPLARLPDLDDAARPGLEHVEHRRPAPPGSSSIDSSPCRPAAADRRCSHSRSGQSANSTTPVAITRRRPEAGAGRHADRRDDPECRRRRQPADVEPWRMIAPAPRKPMPVTTWAAIRVGSSVMPGCRP